MDTQKQKRIAVLVTTGAIMFFGGIVFWFILVGGGASNLIGQGNPLILMLAGLPIGITILGLLVAGYGLYLGWQAAFSDDTKDILRTSEGCYIIAALVLNSESQPVYDIDMYDESEIHRFIQIRFADGSAREYEVGLELFSRLGEGMRGVATTQGKKLHDFVPTMPPY